MPKVSQILKIKWFRWPQMAKFPPKFQKIFSCDLNLFGGVNCQHDNDWTAFAYDLRAVEEVWRCSVVRLMGVQWCIMVAPACYSGT